MRLDGVEYKLAVLGKTPALVFSVSLLGFGAGVTIRAQGARHGNASNQPLSGQESARVARRRQGSSTPKVPTHLPSSA